MLKQLQHNFRTSVLQKDLQDLSPFSSANAAERFAVYRHSVFENLRECLRIVFPGVWKLLGDDCANSMAYTLIRSCNKLPSSGCLDDWDSRFADVLAAAPELQSLPYIKDYAEYEWIQHLSYSAKNANSILPQDLQNVAEDQLGALQFSFLPSLFLYSSCYPIQQIQNIIEDPNAEAINLITAQVYAVILRPTTEVLTMWIDRDLWLFLDYLKQGATLEHALSQVSAEYQDFDAGQALGFMLQHALIKGLNICT